MGKNRDYRQLESGHHYHIYNRGNHKEDIAFLKIDFKILSSHLFECFSSTDEKLIAYCVMFNHFHLLVEVEDPAVLPKVMKRFGMKAAKYFNRRHNTVGHLFQDRYKHRPINSLTDLVYTSRYIHRNPTDAGLTKTPLNYKWTSLHSYLATSPSNGLHSDTVLQYFDSQQSYYNFVFSNDITHQLETLKQPHLFKSDISKLLDYKITAF